MSVNVFPVVAESKRPAVKGWQQRAAPEASWGALVTGRWAAPTGPTNGFWVLDVDPRHGGDKSLRGLGDLPQGADVATPSGGAHYYFKWTPACEGITNSAGRLGPGLDIRAEGGYVLVPPTPGYEALGDGTLQEAPAWLLELLRAPRATPNPLISLDETVRSPVAHLSRALAAAIEEIREAPPGTRDHTMNRNAYGIGRLIEAAGADEFKVGRELIDACVAAGYSVAKERDCIPRALRDGMGNPREVAAAPGKGTTVADPLVPSNDEQLLPLPDKTKDKPAYQAWMRTLRDACDALIVVTQYDQARVLYERVEDRRVEVLGSTDVQSAAIRRIGRRAGLLVPRGTSDAMALDYRGSPDANVSNPSLWDSGSGLYRWPTPVVAAGPTPTWDGILSRLSDVDAFLAHVWAAFEPRYKGRQVMWLQGEGSDMKSISLNAILDGSLGPNALGIANDDDVMRGSQFLFSNIWDKVALLVNDSKQVNLMMTGFLHRLTGRDYIGVEYKHGPRFAAKYQGVVWVTSNLRPNIEGNRSNMSRLTILTLKPGNWVDDLENRLRDEMPALLDRARTTYASACPRHYEIALNATSLRLLKEATGGETDTFRAALKVGGVVFDPEGFVFCDELVASMRLDIAQRTSLYRWLREQPGVKQSKYEGNRGFKGLRKIG